jgi:hypothetical protein
MDEELLVHDANILSAFPQQNIDFNYMNPLNLWGQWLPQ